MRVAPHVPVPHQTHAAAALPPRSCAAHVRRPRRAVHSSMLLLVGLGAGWGGRMVAVRTGCRALGGHAGGRLCSSACALALRCVREALEIRQSHWKMSKSVKVFSDHDCCMFPPWYAQSRGRVRGPRPRRFRGVLFSGVKGYTEAPCDACE